MMNIEAVTDTKPKSETSKAKNTSNVDRKDKLAGTVTLIALGSFAAFIIILSLLLAFTAMSDLAWNRYIYLMTGIETITFTAIGWLFGKEVYRGQAEQMEKLMGEVKEESKQQIASLKSDMAEVTKRADDEQEKAGYMLRDLREERERGHALYQAIQQLAKAQQGREFAQRDFIDRFSLVLLGLLSDISPDKENISKVDIRDFTFEFYRILRDLTQEDINSVIDLANQLYPEMKRLGNK
jgi:hypothetical protein